ncbi:MAG: RNA methyltransferase [Nitrospinota bacterium]
MVAPLYLALVHHPVQNRKGEEVAASVTSLDLHDVSRAARTYGVRRLFVVHPSEAQRRFVRRVRDHWREGWGAEYNPTRREALELLEDVGDLGECVERVERREGQRPRVVTTSARQRSGCVGFAWLRERLERGEGPWLLLLGTGWGLAGEAERVADHRLEPLRGAGEPYNHLSVRCAAAIILDRLLGERGRGEGPGDGVR